MEAKGVNVLGEDTHSDDVDGTKHDEDLEAKVGQHLGSDLTDDKIYMQASVSWNLV